MLLTGGSTYVSSQRLNQGEAGKLRTEIHQKRKSGLEMSSMLLPHNNLGQTRKTLATMGGKRSTIQNIPTYKVLR